MAEKILRDLYCYLCSLQFDGKKVYDMHQSIMHNYENKVNVSIDNKEIIRVRKIRRSVRKGRKSFTVNLIFVGVNANGLKSKKTSLKKLVVETGAAVVMIQETKFKNPGNIRLEGFKIFERIRKFYTYLTI